MRLYLVQHAEAKSKEEDPTRDLTDKGLSDIRKVANYSGKLNLAVSQVFHSGKTRALRTAEVLAEALKPPKGVSETAGLAPLDDPGMWAERISRTAEDLVLVGHLPHLAKLAALLLCGDRDKSVVNFKMGGMVCLGRSDTGWGLEWMIIPEVVL